MDTSDEHHQHKLITKEKQKMSAKTMTVNTEIDPELKRASEEILKRLGLTFSEAIQLFLKQVIVSRGLPFEMNIPNAETLQALAEAEQKDRLDYFETPEELFEDLGISGGIFFCNKHAINIYTRCQVF
jgi:DNA-damage-inducible protein J